MARMTRLGYTEGLDYKPEADPPRQIAALVDRQLPEGLGRAAAPAITLTVLNDELLGIDLDELVRGGDQIAVAEKRGGTAIDRLIVVVAAQDDPDFVTIEV